MRIFVITKRTLIIWILILALVITGIILLLSFTPNAAAVSSSAMVEAYEMEVLAGRHKEVPVYSVDRADKKIALTIDAAWEDDKTPFILDTLAQYNVKATFFLCGFWVEKYPEEVKQIAAAICFTSSGYFSTQKPHRKKVAFTLYWARVSRIKGVLSSSQAASMVRAIFLSALSTL